MEAGVLSHASSRLNSDKRQHDDLKIKSSLVAPLADNISTREKSEKVRVRVRVSDTPLSHSLPGDTLCSCGALGCQRTGRGRRASDCVMERPYCRQLQDIIIILASPPTSNGVLNKLLHFETAADLSLSSI